MENKNNIQQSIDEAIENSEKEETALNSGEHHHHHHHSHRHHHRRRSNSAKKKDKRLIKFFKRNKSVIINIVACLIAVVLLVLLAVNRDGEKPVIIPSDDTPIELTQTTFKIESTLYTEEVPLVHQAIFSYMDENNKDSAHDVFGTYQGYRNRLDNGVPLTYNYSVIGMPSNISTESAVLEISENDSFSSPISYVLDLGNGSNDIYNLKTGTQYYYKLLLTLSNGDVVSTGGEFVTADSPRFLNIEGAVNVRDFGGRLTESGKRIPLGLLFRGSELDGAVESKYSITKEGQSELVLNLGVRFDMDLRSETVNAVETNALGKGVVHRYYDAPQYDGIFEEVNTKSIRNVFADLADEENYPIYMHCTYGRDRTGTMCYLLGALLGMSKDDLYRDYELSAFVDSYVDDKAMAVFIARLELLEGDSMKEKVENYLTSIGVTEAEIQSIRNIFLGE